MNREDFNIFSDNNVVYFDNAATTRVKDEVLNEMLPYLKEKFGNY